jgi:hypothetical protein
MLELSFGRGRGKKNARVVECGRANGTLQDCLKTF